MSKTSFTPGPWTATPEGNGEWGIDSEEWGIAHVAGAAGMEEPNGRSNENAHLIAAAPDLYAALAEAYEFAETANEWFGRDAAGEAQVNASPAMHQKAFYVSERLSAALAKARGES